MTERYCLLKVEGNHAELVLNRPEVLNAADEIWMNHIHEALDELESISGLHTVVVKGAGTSFSTGIDLYALARGEISLEWFRRWEQALQRLEMLEPVTIARLQGYVIGGGLQIALACDLRVAADSSHHGLPAVLEALIPGLGTWRLSRLIGLGRAKRMVLTGELITAQAALEIGLVDWLVPMAQLDAKLEEVASQMRKGSRTAQFLSKRLVNGSFHTSLDEILEIYMGYQARALSAPEHAHAMDEYLRQKAARAQAK